MANPRYSILPARAVFDGRLSHIDVRVLAALGTYTDRDGWCFPSQRELVEKLGLARSTICDSIQRLSAPALGYLEVRPRTTKGRGKVGNEYRVKMDLPPVQEPMSAGVDIGAQVIDSAPMSASVDIGPMSAPADMPMSAPADIAYKRTTPYRTTPPLISNEIKGVMCLAGPENQKPRASKAGRKKVAYTPEFEALWRSWPKVRRAVSNKAVAFTRWCDAIDQWDAATIQAAADRYLNLRDVRKENWRYCCLAEVFLNGKLEAAVEAVTGAIHEPTRKIWNESLMAFVEEAN